MSKAVAYDYDRQEWVEGGEAEAQLAQQNAETLAVIDEPSYRRMMGLTAADALRIKAQLRG